MKVKVLTHSPHSLSFGGFEYQMINAMNASMDAGVDISPLDFWSKDSNYNILQCWGLSEAHLPSITFGRASGKKIVISALLPYLSTRLRLSSMVNSFLNKSSIIDDVISKIDILVLVNEEQANTACKIYGFERNKIKIIPNIVDKIFFTEDNVEDEDGFQGFKDYVICVGAISSRKNQLLLAQASEDQAIPILFIGSGLPGEEAYLSTFCKYINDYPHLKWIDGIKSGSKELMNAYRNSIGFALASYNETQPISALEAAAMAKPLLLSNLSWAKQDLYNNSYLVDPYSKESIREGLNKIKDNKVMQSLKPFACNSSFVGASYKELYASLIE
ncbi:glycosyltransferase family 4 protein [Gammaproteobacteria bacterium]|nr:glycosyltransferase family 4 protein [Gammaproteobacteria bacterium]